MSADRQLVPGEIRLRNVSRRFKVVHDKSSTLKELLIRRKRTVYSELWAVQDVSFDIAPGEAVGIVGRNGSGKSTLLKMLAGIIPPHDGTVETAGTVASMLELGAGFHPDFTGRENVFMNGAIHGIDEKGIAERLDDIIAFAEIEDFIDMPVRTYSSGMQMRLAFAVASHVDPDILLLDEVLAVGDEAFQGKCLERMYAYRRGGGTIVFVSHDPNAVEQICDRAILMADGHLMSDDVPAKILAQYHRRLADGAPHAGDGLPDEAEGPGEGASEDDATRQWGNRRAVITHAELRSDLEPREAFVSGDPVTLRLTVQANEALTNPIVGLQVHALDRTLIYETHSGLDGATFPQIGAGDATQIDFRIPALPIHTGTFKVTVAVSDDGILCHHLEQWLELTVFSAAQGNGLVDLSGQWAVTPARGSSTP